MCLQYFIFFSFYVEILCMCVVIYGMFFDFCFLVVSKRKFIFCVFSDFCQIIINSFGLVEVGCGFGVNVFKIIMRFVMRSNKMFFEFFFLVFVILFFGGI